MIGGNMRMRFLVLTLFVLNPVAVFAADMDRTGRLLNGRVWLLWTTSQKIAYVQGVADGIEICSASNKVEFPEALACRTCTVSDVTDLIDGFYNVDRAVRVVIPIPLAMKLALMKTHGASTDEIAAATAAMIKEINSSPQR